MKTARQKFKIGQRVKLSQSGKKANLGTKSEFGVVAGFCMSPLLVSILVQGLKTPQRFWMGFWE